MCQHRGFPRRNLQNFISQQQAHLSCIADCLGIMPSDVAQFQPLRSSPCYPGFFNQKLRMSPVCPPPLAPSGPAFGSSLQRSSRFLDPSTHSVFPPHVLPKGLLPCALGFSNDAPSRSDASASTWSFTTPPVQPTVPCHVAPPHRRRSLAHAAELLVEEMKAEQAQQRKRRRVGTLQGCQAAPQEISADCLNAWMPRGAWHVGDDGSPKQSAKHQRLETAALSIMKELQLELKAEGPCPRKDRLLEGAGRDAWDLSRIRTLKRTAQVLLMELETIHSKQSMGPGGLAHVQQRAPPCVDGTQGDGIPGLTDSLNKERAGQLRMQVWEDLRAPATNASAPAMVDSRAVNEQLKSPVEEEKLGSNELSPKDSECEGVKLFGVKLVPCLAAN